MKKLLFTIAALLTLAGPVHAQGTLPIAMNVQQDANGRPLAGALLYTYVIGTLATPQIAFQDISLTRQLPWPIPADQNGRLPMFYLPSGSVHARLTDASGGIQFDYPNVLVIGGAGGGAGGGPTVDPSAVASVGDIKWRPTSETLAGWVILNGQTIGNAVSGGTQIASPNALSLFLYLWANCPNTNCPVTPNGHGSSALADFNAGKQIQLLDLRGAMMAGRDCMGSTCLGHIPASVVTAGGDADTAQATGGTATTGLALVNLPTLNLPVSVAVAATQVLVNVPSTAVSTNVTVTGGVHSHGVTGAPIAGGAGLNAQFGTGGDFASFPSPAAAIGIANSGALTLTGTGTGATAAAQASGGTNTSTGSGAAFLGGSNAPIPTISPFMLGTFYQKL